MKKIGVVLLLVGLFCLVDRESKGQSIKDAFVLVDVSGSMRSVSINQEAKNIIKSFLEGTFSVSSLPEGWTVVDGKIKVPGQIIRKGSTLAIVPVGNKDRYRESKVKAIEDISEFGPFYNESYFLNHADGLTFLTLAQGYAGMLANQYNLTKSYMFIYSDALNDETGSRPYTDYENKLVDAWNRYGQSSYITRGILSKKDGIYTYKIYIGELTTYKICPKCGNNPCTCPSPVVLKITKPKNPGDNKKEPKKLKVGEVVDISWSGAVSPLITFSKYDGKYYKSLNVSDPEARVVTKGGTFAKVKFYESGEYKVTVSKDKQSSSAFFDVSSPFPVGILLLIVAIVGSIVGLVKWINRPQIKPVDEDDNGFGWEQKEKRTFSKTRNNQNWD